MKKCSLSKRANFYQNAKYMAKLAKLTHDKEQDKFNSIHSIKLCIISVSLSLSLFHVFFFSPFPSQYLSIIPLNKTKGPHSIHTFFSLCHTLKIPKRVTIRHHTIYDIFFSFSQYITKTPYFATNGGNQSNGQKHR